VTVTPGKAGVQGNRRRVRLWMPAFAGMTKYYQAWFDFV
jgi:hypothetical protein